MTNMDNVNENTADRAATDPAPAAGDVQGFGGAAGGVVLRLGGPAGAQSVEILPGVLPRPAIDSKEEMPFFRATQ